MECAAKGNRRRCSGTANRRCDGCGAVFYCSVSHQVCEKVESRCSFLDKLGIHRVGMWIHECSCGDSSSLLDHMRSDKGWSLASRLCPCTGPLSILKKQLSSWSDYYEWRGIPLDSPVALLLHWPLTIYQAIQLAFYKDLIPETAVDLCIHYLVSGDTTISTSSHYTEEVTSEKRNKSTSQYPLRIKENSVLIRTAKSIP